MNFLQSVCYMRFCSNNNAIQAYKEGWLLVLLGTFGTSSIMLFIIVHSSYIASKIKILKKYNPILRNFDPTRLHQSVGVVSFLFSLLVVGLFVKSRKTFIAILEERKNYSDIDNEKTITTAKIFLWITLSFPIIVFAITPVPFKPSPGVLPPLSDVIAQAILFGVPFVLVYVTVGRVLSKRVHVIKGGE